MVGKAKAPIRLCNPQMGRVDRCAEKGAVGKTRILGGDIRKMENVCNWVQKKD